MKIQGKLHKIFETVQISEKFKKRDFVLEIATNPAYVQKVQFTLTGDNTELADSFNVGNDVEVDYNLQGREWVSPTNEVKYFNTISVYKMALVNIDSNDNSFSENELKTRVQDTKVSTNETDDDLPF